MADQGGASAGTVSAAGSGDEPSAQPVRAPLFQSTFLDRLAIGLLAVLLVALAIQDAQPGVDRSDFAVYMTIGRLLPAGEIANVHDREFLRKLALAQFEARQAEKRARNPEQLQSAGPQRTPIIAWSYPPPFTAVVALLAMVPDGWALALFQGSTLWLLLWSLGRLEPRYRTFVLACVFPAALQNLISGQNGALTGGLIAAACVLLLRRRSSAGLPLGAMIIKPHLVAALALVPVLQRRIGVVGVALATVAVAAALSSWLLGPSIWPAFLHGAGNTAEMIQQDQRMLYRMTSLYGTAVQAGAPFRMAMGIQLASAVLALSVLAHALLKGLALHRLLAIAALASPLITPYLYDYDMPLLAVVVALLARDLASIGTRGEQVLAVALCWLIPLFGVLNAIPAYYDVLVNDAEFNLVAWLPDRVTFAGPLLLVMLWLIVRIVMRAEAADRKTRVGC